VVIVLSTCRVSWGARRGLGIRLREPQRRSGIQPKVAVLGYLGWRSDSVATPKGLCPARRVPKVAEYTHLGLRSTTPLGFPPELACLTGNSRLSRKNLTHTQSSAAHLLPSLGALSFLAVNNCDIGFTTTDKETR
jgi:hypothetical protein